MDVFVKREYKHRTRTGVADAVLVVVVRQVDVGGAGAPGELEDDHAGRADGLAQLHHVGRDHPQVLRDDRHLPQLLRMSCAVVKTRVTAEVRV